MKTDKFKTNTVAKKIREENKVAPKKQGRPVGSKNKKNLTNGELANYWNSLVLDQPGVDNDPGIDVPLHARGGEWKWNFEQKPSFMEKYVNQVTWILTAVNVAILITLAILHV